MTAGAPKNVYFTVGPSQLYPSTTSHLELAVSTEVLSMSHTGERFKDMYRSVGDNLRELFDIPSSHQVFFTGSSTESMHVIVSSTVGKTSAHLITGGFSRKFQKSAKDLHKNAVEVLVDHKQPFEFTNLKIPNNTELLCITENDTSIGAQIPLLGLSGIKALHPGMLVAVDIVSSAPYADLDYSVVDIAFFSVHKGMGLPAGLGVLIVSNDAVQKARKLKEKGVNIGGHHSLLALADKYQSFITPETPNVLNIFLLDRILQDFRQKGISVIRNQTEQRAKRIYDVFEENSNYQPVVHSTIRSMTTPVHHVEGKAHDIVRALSNRGILVSAGYRPNERDHLRIANFPATSDDEFERLISELETVL